jgi:N-acetylneuraminic acid mutarotase
MRRGWVILAVWIAATTARGAWEPATDYPFPALGVAAGVLDGVLYTAGGITPGPEEPIAVHDAYRFDRVEQSWTALADLPALLWGACGVVADGRFFVLGGQSDAYVAQAFVYAYDPGEDTWSRVADLPVPLYGAACAFDEAGGTIHVAGGLVENKGVDSITDFHFTYDVAEDQWKVSTPLPRPLGGPAGGFVGGAFVVAAGNDADVWPAMGATFVFDVGGSSWDEGDPIPHDRMYPASAVVGGKLYVLGGWLEGLDDPVTAVDLYDPSGAGWSGFDALPAAGGMPAAVGAASEIVVLGGGVDYEAGAFLASMYRYDLFTNSPPEFVSDPTTTVVAGEFYQYDPVVVDPDPFDVLTFALMGGPAGMTVDEATGRVYWEPSATGEFPVSLRVADPEDARDVQSYTITVTPEGGDDDAGDDSGDDDAGGGDDAGGDDNGGCCCGA